MPISTVTPSSYPLAYTTSSSLPLSTTRKRDAERKQKFEGYQHFPPPAVLRFEIGDFAGLDHPKGSFVETRSIRSLDKSWHLRVYPRGHERSRSDRILVSCFLTVSDDNGGGDPPSSEASPYERNDLEFSFRIRDWKMAPKRCGFRTDVAYGFMGHTREKILEQGLNEDGTLVVDVALKFWSPPPPEETTATLTNQHLKKPKLSSALAGKLARSDEFADLAFCVGPTVFKAHKCVLALRARPLLELALHEHEEDDDTLEHRPIPIPGVEENVFSAFLDYVYTYNEERLMRWLSESESSDNFAKSLLVAADKFGATDLKIKVESVLADRYLSKDNCCEMLLWADSHWCALLKEEAMNLYCSDPKGCVSSRTGWNQLAESPRLLSELLIRSVRHRRKRSSRKGGRRNPHRRLRDRRRLGLEDLNVRVLREGLEAAGLDPDGSREMLIRRFREYHQSRFLSSAVRHLWPRMNGKQTPRIGVR